MLARLAVEQSEQGRGLDEVMLFDAVKRVAKDPGVRLRADHRHSAGIARVRACVGSLCALQVVPHVSSYASCEKTLRAWRFEAADVRLKAAFCSSSVGDINRDDPARARQEEISPGRQEDFTAERDFGCFIYTFLHNVLTRRIGWQAPGFDLMRRAGASDEEPLLVG